MGILYIQVLILLNSLSKFESRSVVLSQHLLANLLLVTLEFMVLLSSLSRIRISVAVDLCGVSGSGGLLLKDPDLHDDEVLGSIFTCAGTSSRVRGSPN